MPRLHASRGILRYDTINIMSRVNQLPEIINMDDDGHIEDHEIIHEALRDFDVEIASKANAEHTHQWAEIESTPETYPPSSHEHSADDINSGTLNIARIPVGTASGTVAAGDDSRLTDARTPKTHSHQISEVTNLQTTLDSKSNSNHAHSAADVTSGTFNISRIPVGTASGTVASGNDPRFTDSRTPKAHTHEISDVTNLEQRLDIKADLVGGKVPTSQIPAMALTKPFSVTSRGEMTALDAQEGDIAIISAGADKGSYILGDGPSTSFDSWLLLAVESNAPVQSVNGQTGTIVLSPLDIGAAPESHSHTIAQITNLQTTLNQKANADHTHSISNITGLEAELNGKANATHTHSINDITASGSKTSSTFLRGDGTWATPTNTTYTTMTQAEASAGTVTTGRVISSKVLKDTIIQHSPPVTAASLTGALTGQVDASQATVDFYINGQPETDPLSGLFTHILSFLDVIPGVIDGKADADHTHTVAEVGAEPAAWSGTQAQFDALGTKNPNRTYYIVD